MNIKIDAKTQEDIVKMVRNPPHAFDQASKYFDISRDVVVNIFVSAMCKELGIEESSRQPQTMPKEMPSNIKQENQSLF